MVDVILKEGEELSGDGSSPFCVIRVNLEEIV